MKIARLVVLALSCVGACILLTYLLRIEPSKVVWVALFVAFGLLGLDTVSRDPNGD